MRSVPLYRQEKERLQRGITIAQRKFAQKLLCQGMTLEEIAELTEFSREEVTTLRNQFPESD
jgi:predicted transposase YdaD